LRCCLFEYRRLRTARVGHPSARVLVCCAYPDDARVLAQTERMLGNFHRRADLRRHRAALVDTGIAGTTTHQFFIHRGWFRCWPQRFQLDRGDANRRRGYVARRFWLRRATG
jgi:hypothetical protein